MLNLNKTHHIDCLEGMKLLEPGSIDVIITSPPYNIGKKYGDHHDSMPPGDYLTWMHDVAKECHRVLEPYNGALYLNLGGKPSNQIQPILAINVFFAARFDLQNVIHWIKSVAIDDVHSFGHFKPVNSDQYLSSCAELIYHMVPTERVYIDKFAVGAKYTDKRNIKRWKRGEKKGDLRDRGNTWYIPYETTQVGRDHPAVFPVMLPIMCMRLHGVKDGMVVLDPFMGEGSTGLAARDLGVDFIGFEINNKYVKMANKYIKMAKRGD